MLLRQLHKKGGVGPEKDGLFACFETTSGTEATGAALRGDSEARNALKKALRIIYLLPLYP